MIDEVRRLLDSGIKPDDLIYYGLEYKFITLYLTGALTLDEMISSLEIAIHQFAKRQMTWFRRERDVTMINKDIFSNNHEIVNYIMKLAVEKGICSCREG